MGAQLSDETAEEIVRTSRAAIGDQVRTVTFITEHDYEFLYEREDVDRITEETGFIDAEQRGFASQRTYGWSDLGDYEYTIRAFEKGFIGRVIHEDRGVYVAADALTIETFTEAAEALKTILEQTE